MDYESRYTGEEIDAGIEKAELSISFTPQELEESEKETARENIGAGTYSKPAYGIPASDLQEGAIPDVSQFITKSVDDLLNYYLKTETFTKTEILALIAAVKQFVYRSVDTLPETPSADTMGIIYLVPSADPQEQDVKVEYITIDNGIGASPRYTWERIGSTTIDLSDYVTTEALNTTLAAYTTTENLNTLLAAKQDKPTHFAVESYNYFCIRIDQSRSFLRLDVTYDGRGLGQIVVMTTANPAQAAVIATAAIEDAFSFVQFTYDDDYTYLGIEAINSDEHTVAFDVATLSGEAPAMRSIFADDIAEAGITPAEFTRVSYLADNAALAGKQDTLVSGQNIKTVNGNSLLGSGNVSIPTAKDYAENNPQDSAYIQNRPGGYDYEIYSGNSPIEYSDGFTRDSEEYDYILEDVIGNTGDDLTLRQMLEHGYTIPCTYVPADGELAGETLNGTITYELEGEGVTLHSATGDDSTEAGSLSIDLSAIPNGELEDDIYHFPVQFPSKYIPHDSTKQDVLTFDNVPTQNSSNPVKSGGVYDALAGKEATANKVTSLSSSSTDTEYPSAKCVWDLIGDVESLINAL